MVNVVHRLLEDEELPFDTEPGDRVLRLLDTIPPTYRVQDVGLDNTLLDLTLSLEQVEALIRDSTGGGDPATAGEISDLRQRVDDLAARLDALSDGQGGGGGDGSASYYTNSDGDRYTDASGNYYTA